MVAATAYMQFGAQHKQGCLRYPHNHERDAPCICGLLRLRVALRGLGVPLAETQI